MAIKVFETAAILMLAVAWMCCALDVPVVQIKNGTLQGLVMKSRTGREFHGFLGIPYALPPVGELRFQPPQPAAAWTDVYHATEDANICCQRNIYTHEEDVYGDEDCLYLNVFSPKVASKKDNVKYPVMIWFHGGGWVTGAGHSEYYGPKFLLDKDVVLVTLNYRLGPLGFLSTEDMVIPGNQGMKDQAQAIRWVHENIAAFGGDPDRVTLFGESAGGVAVHYHMISNLSKGLFHRGISQSGTAHCPWALTRPGLAKKTAKRLGQLMMCPSENSKEMLKCLQTRKPLDIIATDRAYQVFDYCPMIPFRPVVEPKHPGAFLAEDPSVSAKQGRVNDLPWMTGVSSEEGAIRTAGIFGLHNGELLRILDRDWSTLAPVSLLYDHTCPADQIERVTKDIREFYFGDSKFDNSSRADMTDMYSDAWFNMAADEAVEDHLNLLKSPIYYYLMAYKGSSSFTRIFGDPDADYGVSHADDLQYLFPVGDQLFKDVPLTEQDLKMVDILTTLWVNFAATGNPNPKSTDKTNINWTPVATEKLEYLDLKDPQHIKMKSELNSKRVNFWRSLPTRDRVHSGKNCHDRKDEL